MSNESFKPIKSITSGSTNKIVNSSFYGTINLNSNFSGSGNSDGYVFAPYVLVEHTEESLNDYNNFMKKYRENHKYCPKCGGSNHITTLIAYPMYSDRREEYKDLNISICDNCGDKHTVHERIK